MALHRTVVATALILVAELYRVGAVEVTVGSGNVSVTGATSAPRPAPAT